MESNHYLIDFYKAYDEDSRLQSKHGSIEFLTTMRHVERYSKPGNRILEIGVGTGRYSHTLARWGYVVDAVELVEHNIKFFRKIYSRMSILRFHRATLWICLPFRIINMM